MSNVESSSERHKQLVEHGWEMRFTAEEPRLSEMKEFYESLGLEVLVETGVPDDGRKCRGCFDLEGLQDRYKTMYTRQGGKSARTDSDDLFE